MVRVVRVDGLEKRERRFGDVAAFHVQPDEDVFLFGDAHQLAEVIQAEVFVDFLPHHRKLDRDVGVLKLVAAPLPRNPADEFDVGVSGGGGYFAVVHVLAQPVQRNTEALLVEVADDDQRLLKRLCRDKPAGKKKRQLHRV